MQLLHFTYWKVHTFTHSRIPLEHTVLPGCIMNFIPFFVWNYFLRLFTRGTYCTIIKNSVYWHFLLFYFFCILTKECIWWQTFVMTRKMCSNNIFERIHQNTFFDKRINRSQFTQYTEYSLFSNVFVFCHQLWKIVKLYFPIWRELIWICTTNTISRLSHSECFCATLYCSCNGMLKITNIEQNFHKTNMKFQSKHQQFSMTEKNCNWILLGDTTATNNGHN